MLLLVGVAAACCSNGTHLLHLKTIVAGSISCRESAENGRNCEETQDSNGNCQAVSGPAEISHTTFFILHRSNLIGLDSTAKDVSSYVADALKQEAKIAEMRAAGADESTIKKQEEVQPPHPSPIAHSLTILPGAC